MATRIRAVKGLLILALKQYVNPQKYASAWNFGTKPNTLTSVKKIVEYIISFWGSGSMIVKKNKLYEQVNLQLNIKKAQKILKWNPTYNIKESVKLTTQWYKEILIFKKSPEKVTHYQIRKYMNDSKIN